MSGQGMRQGLYVGLGANLGDPVAQVRQALRLLDASDTRVLRVSRCYVTAPWGRVDQPEFINAVAELATSLSPKALVDRLLDVERGVGRERGDERWAPRSIDLDLLLDGDARVDMPGCHVPHPRLAQRAFALVPLLELAPYARIPGIGAARDCLAALSVAEREGVRPLSDDDDHATTTRVGARHS